jgi:3-hydroxyisobutyrate dehydrogenase
MRLAFLGLGLMGAPMAERLLASGATLSVWNRSPAKAEALVARGALRAATPADAAADSEIVFVCLTDAGAIEEICFGAGGIAERGNAKAILVDLSTTGPVATLALAARLRERCGMRWVDAPVTGGPGGAADGTLGLFVGGADDDVADVRDAARPLYRRFVHMGKLGAGQTTKLCNQIVVTSTFWSLAEMFALASRAGVRAASLPQVFEGGFADSRILQVFGERMATRDFSLRARSRVMVKDLDLIQAMAAELGASLPLNGLVAQLMRLHVARGHGDDDVTTVIRMYDGA